MSSAVLRPNNLVVVGNSSDNPFAIDVAYAMGQREDIADLISMKTFANSEFCPRFICGTRGRSHIGRRLAGKTVVIVSTSSRVVSRQNLAMRNMLIARSAKENGAQSVALLEPDLYYSAQDRGANHELGSTLSSRREQDLKKFDGQPFTAKLYAEMLKLSGVDTVVTTHNHSYSVQSMFSEVFGGQFHNLIPYEIYKDYLLNSNIVSHAEDGEGLVLCAPDRGAREFVREMFRRLDLPKARFILLNKTRTGERKVKISLDEESVSAFDSISGHDIVLFDDMVRTGSTVVKSCQFLKQLNPGRLIFAVTHFYASDEGREKMAHVAIDEILTLNTLPTVLNRDVQGRLRRKMVVLKIEKWLASNLRTILNMGNPGEDSLYQIDMSSKNPRFSRKIWGNSELSELREEREILGSE